MFVFNVKIPSAKKLTPLFAALAVAVAVVCIICMVKVQSGTPDSATCDEIGAYSLRAETAEEQVEFLSRFGIKASGDGRLERNVTIPPVFNKTYLEYNKLQEQIGLDLSRFKGKSVLEVTLSTDNRDYSRAVLLIYNGRVIGGHITNGEYGGKNMPLNTLWKDSTK